MRPSQDGTGKDPVPFGSIPDFCSLQAQLLAVVAAVLIAFLLAFASLRPLDSLLQRLGPLALFIEIIILVALSALCLMRRWLASSEYHWRALAVWSVSMVATAAVSWAAYMLVPWGQERLFASDGLVGLMTRSLGICALMVALLLRHHYVYTLGRRKIQAEADARFRVLQARIRPHFLFNSINTIASLIHTQPRLAEELLEDLADLFRAAFKKNQERATLGTELELAKRYLHIEKHRLGDRFTVEWDIDELPSAAELPPLILQPLVENAVYHGIQPARGSGMISIVGRYRRGQVNLSVRNTLPDGWVDKGASGLAGRFGDARERSRGSRMALENVRQRLALMYPGAAAVNVLRVDGDYQVRLTFPYPWNER